MKSQSERAHGVTPGLSRDYAKRTAVNQAAFVLPYLQPGMDLLDMGCGPGSITLGLAGSVAPGQVVGVDHDKEHIRAAERLAKEQGVGNIIFQRTDALHLPFDDSRFDAVFENNLFTHLAQDAVRAAGEAYRVLKPGGFLAARDTIADAVVWGNHTEAIQQFDRLFYAWYKQRGSDLNLGRNLPAVLREAGFVDTLKSVSADTKGDPQSTRSHADILCFLLDGPLGQAALAQGWTDQETIKRLKDGVRAWGEHPDSFFANVHVEVIGWKPD